MAAKPANVSDANPVNVNVSNGVAQGNRLRTTNDSRVDPPDNGEKKSLGPVPKSTTATKSSPEVNAKDGGGEATWPCERVKALAASGVETFWQAPHARVSNADGWPFDREASLRMAMQHAWNDWIGLTKDQQAQATEMYAAGRSPMSGPLDAIFAIVSATPDWPIAARLVAVDMYVRNVAEVLIQQRQNARKAQISHWTENGAIVVDETEGGTVHLNSSHNPLASANSNPSNSSTAHVSAASAASASSDVRSTCNTQTNVKTVHSPNAGGLWSDL
jgi:hypothetical protein